MRMMSGVSQATHMPVQRPKPEERRRKGRYPEQIVSRKACLGESLVTRWSGNGDVTYKLAPAVAIMVIVIGWRRRWSHRSPATTRPTCARRSSFKEEMTQNIKPTVLDMPAAEMRKAAS